MTVTEGQLCYVNNDSVFASLVVINDYTLASNKFVAYAAKQNGYETGYNTGLYRYTVYVNGSTEPSYIYSEDSNAVKVDAFYEITKAADGKATINQIMGAYGADHEQAGTYKVNNVDTKAGNLYWDRGYVYAFDGESFVNYKMEGKAFTDFFASYRVDDATKYFEVTKTTWANGNGENTTITASDNTALTTEARIVVAYTKNDDGEKVATYVYILKSITDKPADVVVDPTLTLVKVASNKVQATYATGSEATQIKVVYKYRLLGETEWTELETGSEHSYLANAAAQTFDARTVTGGNSTAHYEVYAEAISTAAANKDAVVATSGIIDVIA